MTEKREHLSHRNNNSEKPYLEKQQQKYKKYLHEIFKNTSSYEEFIFHISKELSSRFHIFDWAYYFLNLPDRLAVIETFGTINGDYLSEYVEDRLYENDLLLHHAKLNTKPIFQSDLLEKVKKSEIVSPLTTNYKKLCIRNTNFGITDILCIPITSPLDGSQYMLTMTPRGFKYEGDFKKSASRNIPYLLILAKAINDIGYKSYKNIFLKPVNSYNGFALSQPLNLLSVMGKYDLNTTEGATCLGIAYNTAKNHIANIKQSLGTKTIHGAYHRVIELGLIQ